MRKWIIVGVGAFSILLAFAYSVLPPGHIPPFDANRWRLAETYLEGFCAGEVLVQTQSASRNPAMAQECREENVDKYSSDIDLQSAVIGFCQSVAAGFGMGVTECQGIVAEHKLWPLYDGGFTDDWNGAFGYPGDRVLTPPPSNSRVGDREQLEREELER